VPLTAANFGVEIYFAAGDGLAFGAGLVAGFFAVPVVAAAGLGLASGAGLAAVVCALCFFDVFFAGVSANTAIGSAATARISMSFFM
jgi:hypothetical protein